MLVSPIFITHTLNRNRKKIQRYPSIRPKTLLRSRRRRNKKAIAKLFAIQANAKERHFQSFFAVHGYAKKEEEVDDNLRVCVLHPYIVEEKVKIMRKSFS